MPSASSSASFSGCLPTTSTAIADAGQHLRAEIPQTAVAEHDDAIGAVQRQLRRNLKCRRDRFGEDRDVGRQRIRHEMQVVLRHGDVVGERAVVVDDADRRAVRTVGRPAGQAGRAAPAIAVDLADDASSLRRDLPRRRRRTRVRARREPHVAADQLQVGFADARAQDPDHDFAVQRLRVGPLVLQRDVIAIQYDRSHSPPECRRLHLATRRRSLTSTTEAQRAHRAQNRLSFSVTRWPRWCNLMRPLTLITTRSW